MVRRFSSKAPAKVSSRLEKHIFATATPQLQDRGTPRLPKKAGMHRFLWDMRHAGSWHAIPKRSGLFGPMALPGKYQVKLTMGKWSQIRPLELLTDPRIVKDGVNLSDLKEQFSLGFKIRDAISRARMVAEIIKKKRKELERKKAKRSRAGQKAKDKDQHLTNLEAKLVTAKGTYQTPMLLYQLNYLYYMVIRADQKPGQDAYLRFKELDSLLTSYITELKQIINQ